MKTAKQVRRRLIQLTERIGKDRDELRKVLDDAEALDESVADAKESLDYAIDALSRYA